MAIAGLCPACGTTARQAAADHLDLPVLQSVRHWTIQLQGLESEQALRRLETAPVDMLVVEPMRSQRGMSDFATAALVQRLQKSSGVVLPHKRAIAYLNVGQAEDYRTYWQADWRAPTAAAGGEPAFLLGLDPDGWQGNYPVAYWDPAWRRCLYGAPDAPLDQLLADGFEGAYLDWILGFEDEHVVAAARAAGVDPAAAMVSLLTDLRAYARARYPLFVLIAQNALPLAEAHPEVLAVIDAIAQEDVSFRGGAGVGWDDAAAGDVPTPTGDDGVPLCDRLAAIARRGTPVFTLDYAAQPANIASAYARSRQFGLVPCVTRTPLDRLPADFGLPTRAAPTPR